jgi:hypothetical protein
VGNASFPNSTVVGAIPLQFRQYAIDAHALLDHASVLLRQANIPTFTVYTEVHPSKKTPIQFRVQAQYGGYRILEVTGETAHGDGTVTSESARGDPALDRPSPIYGSPHARMCSDPRVARLVESLL